MSWIFFVCMCVPSGGGLLCGGAGEGNVGGGGGC